MKWQTQTLATVTQRITDGSHNPPTGGPVSEYLMISSKNVYDDELSFDEPRYLTSDQFRQEDKRTGVIAGDVLLTIVGTVGRCAVVPKDAPRFTLQRSVAVVRPNVERITSRFLMYSLLDRNADLNEKARGVAQKGIYLETLRDVEIAVPPLPEQQRIVGKLDAAFAALTEAQAHVERNRANARELFESAARTAIGNEVSDEQKYPLQALLDRRWIIDHMDGNHGGDYPKKEEFIDSGVPYISANCIRNEEVDFSLAKFLSPARASKLRKGFAKNQDVLFAHNATVGPVAMLRTNEPKVILGTSLTYYRCDPEYVIPEYLAHYLRSRWFREQYESVMQQSTRNQVPITKQREFSLIIPSARKQKQIVLALDGLLSDTRQLETTYQQKQTELAGLKKAVLGAAFRGEL